MGKKFQDITTANAAESLYDEDGHLEIAKLKTLSRTYAQAIGGVPSAMEFDPDTAAFRLTFKATVLEAPTVVYLNQDLHYPNGFHVDVQPSDCMWVSLNSTNYLHGWLQSSCQGEMITWTVSSNSSALV